MTQTAFRRDALVEQLRQGIARGEFQPGAMLPSEADLSLLVLIKGKPISRPTVRAALEQLANDGYVESRKGKGWFVRRDQRNRYEIQSVDVGRHIAKRDVWNSWVESLERVGDNILTVRFEVPPLDVVRALRLAPHEEACGRHRTRLVDGEPWMLSTGWFPRVISRGTPIEVEKDMQDPSPLRWLMENGYAPVRGENEIGARMPTAEEAKELHTGRGVPVITMLTTSWDRHGRRVRCTEDVMPAHRFLLVTQHDYHYGGDDLA